MNKYLEKIALFGFSKKEKTRKLHTKLYIDTQNHFAEYSNPRLSKVNDAFKKSGEPFVVNDRMNPKYLKTLVDDGKSDSEMYKTYDPVWKKHKVTADKLGINIGSSSKEYMDNHVENAYSGI